jgi:hypothetical protein
VLLRRKTRTRRFLVSTMTMKSRIHPGYLQIHHLQSSHTKTTYTYPIPIVPSITQRKRKEKGSETETERQ